MISDAHLEVHGSLGAIVQEKGVLVRAAPAMGLVILGADHEYVTELAEMSRAPVVIVSGRGIELSRNITRTVCRHLGLAADLVESALRNFKGPKRRLERLQMAGMTVIDDSYNANPISMKLGLDTLAGTAGLRCRRVAILGFMAELADKSQLHHEEIGDYARSRADVLIGVGELAKYYNPDFWFDSSVACAENIEILLHPQDCLLVKGSHSARMLKVIEKLREIDEQSKHVARKAEPLRRT